MVKGISKRVVVIKSPDKRVFDEAIFIVREDVSAGKTGDDIIREAQEVADTYIQTHIKKKLFYRISPFVAALSGAGAVGIIWAIVEWLI